MSEVWVGTTKGLHVIGNPEQDHFKGQEVNYLTSQNGTIFAVVDGRQIWRFMDNAWINILTMDKVRVNCLLPYKDIILIGTSRARLFEMNAGAPHRIESFDEVQNREEWFTPWGGPPDIRSISSDSSGTIYANVHVGGIIRSEDGGKSWQPTIKLNSDVHQVLVHQGSNTILAPSGRGLAMSHDKGQTWTFQREGLHATYQRAVAVADDILLVSTSTGPYTNHAALYRKPLKETGPFKQCVDGLPERFSDNIDTFCLDASGSTVAAGTERGEVYLSTDKGVVWSRVTEGLSPVRCLTFVND